MARRADKTDTKFLVQCRTLATRWQAADPTAFGLTELEIDQFEARLLAALEARDLAREARNLARARFVGQREAIANLRSLFGALVGSVDVKAKREGPKKAKSVYAAAGIQPPEKPGPLPPPARPGGFGHELTNGGSIVVTFTIDDGARGGLLYEVQRQTADLDGATGEWMPLDIVGVKRFEDDDVPKGVSQVLYRVRAMRTTGLKGEWSYPVTIPFGTMKSEAASAALEVDAERSMEAKPRPEDASGHRETVKSRR
jgi:hypothetical protein